MKALFSLASQEGREESNSLAASKKWGGFPSGGQNMTLSDLRERHSGWERRAGKKRCACPKTGAFEGVVLKQFSSMPLVLASALSLQRTSPSLWRRTHA